MADLVINSTLVLKGSGAQTQSGVSGAAVVAGQPCSLFDDGKYYAGLASGNGMQAGNGGIKIALNSAPGANQPLTLLSSGPYNPGATVASGQVYALSINSGKIFNYSDLVANNWVTILGTGSANGAQIVVPSSGPLITNAQHF